MRNFNLKIFFITFSVAFFISLPITVAYLLFSNSETIDYCAHDEPKPIIQNSYTKQKLQIEDFVIRTPPKHSYISKAINAEDIEKSLRQSGLQKKANVIFRDEKYSFVSFDWFDKYSEWWIDFIKSNDIRYEDNSFDCDNFSDMFMVLTCFSHRSYPVKTNSQIACGTIIVQSYLSFAGVQAKDNSWHSLNIIFTDSGWFVLEPQNGTYISLNSYPNKDNIKAIVF